ncbi:MAG: hypothetical protein ACRD3V_10370, partial [Vicinamibacteria bacterium]
MKIVPGRRRFLRTVTGTAAASGLRRRSQAPSGERRRPERPLDVALFLDIGDVFSPPEIGNDDSILELAPSAIQPRGNRRGHGARG